MALIATQSPTTATGSTREIYDTILGRMSYLPQPTVLLSASPALLETWWKMTTRYLQHDRFTPALTAAIRYLVAFHSDFPYCLDFNARALNRLLGLTDAQLAEIREDPSRIPLSEDERALLLFVLRAVREPEAVAHADLQALRDRGWSDEHIFEAVYYAGWMLHLGLLFNVFEKDPE